MKCIHTADWHIGQDFYHYDRSEEHRFFLKQLCEVVGREQPDLFLLCGDVFHTSTPSNASVKLYTEGMVALHQACPEMKIIVTAGNHDSASRLSSTEEVWKFANLHIIGGLERDSESDSLQLERHIIVIPNKAFVIAVPYVHERNYDVFRQLQRMVEERNSNGLPVLMTGHLALSGSDVRGHDPVMLGGMETVALSDLLVSCDYWALGHIHCPQTLVESKGRARYSGSPLHVSFDENYPHSVSMVTLEKHGDLPEIKAIPIHQSCHLVSLPSKALPLDEVLPLLKEYETEKPAYLRVQVLVKDYLSREGKEKIEAILKQKPDLFFCLYKTEHEAYVNDKTPLFLDTRQIQDMHPLEIARLCYRSKFGVELDEAKVKMLEEVVSEVTRKE